MTDVSHALESREALLRYIEKGRSPSNGRPIANNTRAHVNDYGDPAIRLHYTDVVTYSPSGLYLATGGWHTVTTADRIGMALSAATDYRLDKFDGVLPRHFPEELEPHWRMRRHHDYRYGVEVYPTKLQRALYKARKEAWETWCQENLIPFENAGHYFDRCGPVPYADGSIVARPWEDWRVTPEKLRRIAEKLGVIEEGVLA